MAYVAETETWEDGIYQIEVGDVVSGGVSGTANAQAIQLANRTKYLNSRVTDLSTKNDTSTVAFQANEADSFFYSIAF